MATHRFDPTPGEPYGACTDCGEGMPTKDAAELHMSQTRAGAGPSHRIQVTNGTREQRIGWHVEGEIRDAIDETLQKLADLVHKGHASQEEIETSLEGYPDFDDAWANDVDELLEG